MYVLKKSWKIDKIGEFLGEYYLLKFKLEDLKKEKEEEKKLNRFIVCNEIKVVIKSFFFRKILG